MDGHDDHDQHSSPAAGALVALVIAVIYALIFKLTDGGWTSSVILATVLFTGWGLFQVLVADRD
jgi:hypothetical protein